MKRVLFCLLVLSFPASAQVTNYDYLHFCDKVVVNTNNSVQYLHLLYKDLMAYKKNPNFQFRYFESYWGIKQPDPQSFDKVKTGTNVFYKPIVSDLWKLYNDCYNKGGEIIAYLRLQDYKNDLDKGFRLIREMQQLQKGITEARNKIASKIVTDAKALVPANAFTKSYQSFLKAILHEEELIKKLSMNFNEEVCVGLLQEEILKSYLETDELLQNLKPSNFKLPDMAALRSCYEGLQLIQQAKQTALDDFNNTSTWDGRHANTFHDNLLNYFNNDVLYFLAFICEQGLQNGTPLIPYPVTVRQYDLDAPAQPWAVKHLEYSAPLLDSLAIMKQTVALPVAGFLELNLILEYVNACVGSMDNLYQELRSEEYTWSNIRNGKMPYKNPVIKFDAFKVPVSLYGMATKNSKHLPVLYRPLLMKRVDDLQQIMLVMQDRLIGLSQLMNSGAFREKGSSVIDAEVKVIEQLYSEFDQRKEALYLEVRKAHSSFPLAKVNSWTNSAAVLLKAADDSRKILRQMEARIYEQNEAPISTTNIHDDQRDLITNELKYMNGIQLLGKYNGNCPYTPYERIPDYLKTLEEKVQTLAMPVKDNNKAYHDFLYMHNNIVEQYNKFAELGSADNEYSRRDPVRPVYLLSDIYQLMKYHFDPPKPEIKKEEPSVVIEPRPEPPEEVITFEGYPLNNLVLLLDVSHSMEKPERLPLLKKSFQQMIRLMRKGDQVSIVIYSGNATLALPPTSASDTSRIFKSLKNLKSEGSTNIIDGLTLAYKTARKNFKADGNNRIILATDGEFNTSEPLYVLAEKNATDIPLSVFDFSQKADVEPIQSLAAKGLGNYIKVTPENALKVLASEAQKN
jgi:uncharacterized protein YegL